MKFKEIASRLTGFSVPVFGVSWNPLEPELAVARRVLAFLEDRRVLFNPYHLEVADQCVHSVVEIRQFLTTEIGRLAAGSEFGEHLRGIRAACRKFLDDVPSGRGRILRPHWAGPFEPEFLTQLGELRASIGHRVAAIAVMHGLDIEGDLASTLPEDDKGDVQPVAAADRLRRRLSDKSFGGRVGGWRDRAVRASRSAELSGGFTIPVPPEAAFEFFSPLGEKLWVPEWNPEFLHPPGASWGRGLVFTTQEERGEAVWVVTTLDRERHEVEYHRVEARRYVARVSVRCQSRAGLGTEVRVTYTFVGLSEQGNQDIATMSAESYEEKMRRWQAWINGYLSKRGA